MRVSQVVGSRRSEVVEVPDPVADAGEVLVDVIACGVCTSDLPAWIGRGSTESPIRLGHEVVGRVVAAGSDASRWRPGDIVTGFGGPGFAQRCLMPERAIVPVPVDLDPILAIGEPVATLDAALRRVPATSSRIAVIGLGFMGLGIVQLLRSWHPSLVVGVDPSPQARARALSMGAHEVFHPDDVPARYRESGERGLESRMDTVIEVTGRPSAMSTAVAMLAPFGTLSVVGYHHYGNPELDMELWYKGATLVSGFCPDESRLYESLVAVVERIGRREFSYAPLITHHVDLDGIDDAFALIEHKPDDFVKAVLVP